MRALLRTACLLALFLWACQASVAPVGTLTLAPAGMRASDGCVVAEDKTSLMMPVGGRAMTVTYVPKGKVRAAVMGRSLGKSEIELVVFFDGERVAKRKVDPGTVLAKDGAFWFTVEVGASAPHSWEIEVHGEREAGEQRPVFQFEKLVITGS